MKDKLFCVAKVCRIEEGIDNIVCSTLKVIPQDKVGNSSVNHDTDFKTFHVKGALEFDKVYELVLREGVTPTKEGRLFREEDE